MQWVTAKFNYASWFEAGRRQVRSQIPLRYLVRTIFEPASSQLRTSSEPDCVMEFGHILVANLLARASSLLAS